MKKILLIVFALGVASVAQSQTLSPAIADYRASGDHVNAELTVTNNGIHDMATTLEAHYFERAAKGDIHILPMPSWMHLKFDQSSAVIGPLGSHTFGYTVTCDGHTNCWWMIEANMSTGQIINGLAVMLHLPDLGYMVQKDPLRAADLSTHLTGGKLTVTNSSNKFGRVTLRAKEGKKSDDRVCVMYPNQACEIQFNASVESVELAAPKGKLTIHTDAQVAQVQPAQ